MITLINKKLANRKGFTLIELLVVLAVLAIIALIAIPNFMGIQEQSKVKSDINSCQTIKKAMQLAISAEGLSINTMKFTGGYADCATYVVGNTANNAGFSPNNPFTGTIMEKYLGGYKDSKPETFKAQSKGFKATFRVDEKGNVTFQATKVDGTTVTYYDDKGGTTTDATKANWY